MKHLPFVGLVGLIGSTVRKEMFKKILLTPSALEIEI